MAGISGWLLGGLQLLAGIFLTATGLGSGIGIKLIASGALSLLSQVMGGKARSGLESSPRYGFDNAQNVTIEGQPLAIIYGEEVVAPPIVSAMVRQYGSEQVLMMLLAIGEGEIDSVSEVKLNGTSLSAFAGAFYIVKLGTSDQSATWRRYANGGSTGSYVDEAGFNQTGVPYTASTTVGTGQTHVHEMRAEASELWINLRWPSGLFESSKNGGTVTAGWAGRIYVKAHGAADSTYVEFLIPKDSTGKRVQGDFAETVWGPWTTFANIPNSDLRRTMVVRFTTRGRYDVKIAGLSADDTKARRTPTVVLVTEVSDETRAYANTALLAVKCPASAQLSGSFPTVTCKVKGKKLYDPRTGATAWSRNPALIVRDLLTNTRYGLGARIPSTRIDDGVGGTFRTFADRCEESITPPGREAMPRYQWDGVLDTLAPAREWLEFILATCRAQLFQSQGKLKLSEDRDGASVRSFTDAPATAGSARHGILSTANGVSSLTVRQLGDSERSTVVRIQHRDREKDHRKATAVVQDWRINIGGIVGGTQVAGSVVKGGTSGAVGYLTVAARDGDRFLSLVQDTVATAFVSGEVLTIGSGSTSTCAASSAPYRASPERAADVQAVGITRTAQAEILGRYVLNSALRRSLFASWGIFWGDRDLDPGDIVDITSTRLGWTAKKFTVLGVGFSDDGTGRIEAREYDADAFVIVDRPLEPVYLSPGGSVPPGLGAGEGTKFTPGGATSSGGGGSSAGTGGSSKGSAASGAAGVLTATVTSSFPGYTATAAKT